MYRPETDWIRKWAEYTPDRLLLRVHDSGMEWTYGQSHNVVNRLARLLKEDHGIRHGDRIAVLAKNRPETIFLFFAAMRLGAILVPLNFRLTAEELKVMISDAEPAVSFFEDEFAGTIEALAGAIGGLNSKVIGSLTPVIDPAGPEADEPYKRADLEDPVMILYTSGTTGVPKGAIINHRMLFWNAVNTALRLDLTGNDHTQSFAPLFHTGGWNVLFTPFVHQGASHTMLSGFDADLILELMEKEKTTLLFGVPTMLQMMGDSPLFDQVDLSSVRYAIVGGAPMPVPLIETWHEKGVLIRQGYGLTEVGPNTFSLNEKDAIRKIGSIGFPNFYIDAKIVNEAGAECGVDEVGELWLSSLVVTPGYWKNPEATKKAITDGWFHTGDMMRRDADGYYYVVDRKKNMYISGGENVYPAEVERVLESNEAIRQAVVVGVPDERWGETGAAFIVLNPKGSVSDAEIAEFCKGKLAKYKIPKHLFFVDDIPLNDTGKVDRNKLKEMTNL